MASAEELIASMDAAGVEKSVICGFSWSDPGLCALHNQYLLESAARHSQRLIVFLSLPLTNPDWSARELDQGSREEQGVGEIGFYRHAITARDVDAMKPVLACWRRKDPSPPSHKRNLGHTYPGKGRTRLERFYEIILAFPRLRILLAHWGGGLPFYELMRRWRRP